MMAVDPLLPIIKATDQKATLYAAINDCDTMILQADVDNDSERRVSGYAGDAGRLARYNRRRMALVKHRERLTSLYTSLYNENPWANVPY